MGAKHRVAKREELLGGEPQFAQLHRLPVHSESKPELLEEVVEEAAAPVEESAAKQIAIEEVESRPHEEGHAEPTIAQPHDPFVAVAERRWLAVPGEQSRSSQLLFDRQPERELVLLGGPGGYVLVVAIVLEHGLTPGDGATCRQEAEVHQIAEVDAHLASSDDAEPVPLVA